MAEPTAVTSNLASTMESMNITSHDELNVLTPEQHSTLYPKTAGDIRDLTHNLNQHFSHTNTPVVPICMTGTVKLHGAHADVRVLANNTIVPQSRNIAALTLERDSFDFAKFCFQREEQILRLAERVKDRWRDLPKRPSGYAHTDEEGTGREVMLAGEWVGEKIQNITAMAKVKPRRFVLCAVLIDNVWQRIEDYADLSDEVSGLWNISRGGFFQLTLSLQDSGAEFFEQAKEYTKAVYDSCPYGKALGVEGTGEGIVWMPGTEAPVPNLPTFWLKTKGEAFANRGPPIPRPLQPSSDTEKKARAYAFVQSVCREARLEQGWDYLREMGLERNMKGLGAFLTWVARDIEAEEKRDIDELEISGLWKKELPKVAKAWYVAKMHDVRQTR